jgi:NAD(P)-dependent dehydrogenase (short-subunit alcohol dehydrogenase family)
MRGMIEAPVLLVTGGSRGIGASVCRLAGAAGWQVAVNYVTNLQAAEAVVAEIRAVGGSAIPVQGDVGTELGLASIFSTIDGTFGRLDGLVNNAGIVATAQRVDEMSAERLERMFAVNVMGSIRCAQEAVRRMSTRHGGTGGAIVNLSSVAALLGAAGQYVDYAASKGAIESFTIGLAREVAAEGDMASLIPMQRPGTADEVAQSILYLLSDAASYVTGAALNVSGGR